MIEEEKGGRVCPCDAQSNRQYASHSQRIRAKYYQENEEYCYDRMTLIVLNWLIVSLAKSRVEAEAPPTSIVSCASDGSELCRFKTRFRILLTVSREFGVNGSSLKSTVSMPVRLS